MRTKGEIEDAIGEGISRFEQDYMGRGAKDIQVRLLGDLLVVRLQRVLTATKWCPTTPVESQAGAGEQEQDIHKHS